MSSSPIQFVIWGIRDGFKNSLMTNGSTHTFAAELTDQRQLWNKFKQRFYTIKHVSSHSLLTIYDPTVLDIIGRDTGSTIAVSLVVPSGYRLQCNPLHKLQHLMNYYVSKQTGTVSFSFTQTMFEEEIGNIELIPSTSIPIRQFSIGKKGFIHFQDEGSVLRLFQTLDISPYDEILFFSDDFRGQYPEILQYQYGNKPISSFLPIFRVRLNGYNPSNHEIRLSGKKMLLPASGELDAIPGDVIQVTLMATGQTKIIEIGSSTQSVCIEELFYQRTKDLPSPPSSLKKYLIFVFTFLTIGIIGFEVYNRLEVSTPSTQTYTGEQPEGTVTDSMPRENYPTTTPISDNKDTILFSSIHNEFPNLNQKQRNDIKRFKGSDSINITFISKGIIIEFLGAYDKSITIDKIKKYLNDIRHQPQTNIQRKNTQDSKHEANKNYCDEIKNNIKRLEKRLEELSTSSNDGKEEQINSVRRQLQNEQQNLINTKCHDI